MNIEKLPSGKYRIRQTHEGKKYYLTLDYKPTKVEAMKLLSELMEGCDAKGTFLSACKEYTDSKRNILSPRTIREYEFMPKRLPEWFTRMPVAQITQTEVQRVVNEIAKDKAAKYVRNLHGFISAVLGLANPKLTLKTTLPRKEKTEPYIPSKNDFKRLLEASEGTEYHIPIQLAFYGLRRGEICALEMTDLTDDNVIHVTKDLVQAPSGEWVKKPPKTASSVRDVPIDQGLANEIREKGYIYKGFPNNIQRYFARMQDRLGIERFSPHKLRHLFASVLLDKGYDMKTIQDLGGWNGNETVQKVYLHSLKLKDEESRKKIVADMQDFLN